MKRFLLIEASIDEFGQLSPEFVQDCVDGWGSGAIQILVVRLQVEARKRRGNLGLEKIGIIYRNFARLRLLASLRRRAETGVS
ncbi:MAG: hypothetical protein WC052_02185 [Patescibacteria group bacterium]